MVRFLISLFGGLVLGLGLGLYLGWVQFPVQYIDSPADSLEQQYKDEYVVMIAGGYLIDHDLVGAIQRLRVIGITNPPEAIQQLTERYINTSRDVDDIRPLVAMSEAMGRLTPLMEPYRLVSVPGQTP